jgi:hypothetical protein
MPLFKKKSTIDPLGVEGSMVAAIEIEGCMIPVKDLPVHAFHPSFFGDFYDLIK